MKQISAYLLVAFVFIVANNLKAQDQATTEKPQNGIEAIIPDLTDQQKTEIEKLRIAHMKEIQQIKNQLDIKKAELKALQTAENPDMNAINKNIEERSALRTDLEKKSAAHHQAVRDLLTDDQKVIYDSKTARKHQYGPQAGHKCNHQPGTQCGNKNAKGNCKQ
ncbi:MAG: periplasmic heavy metal sensor [Bacteroidales bacterium]|nr:periplasmic heavy metal sensor [Bacteroidales bacterium]